MSQPADPSSADPSTVESAPARFCAQTRITELEIALTHQQHLCEQLNQVIVGHTKQLIELERVIANLRNEVKELRHDRKEPQFDPQQERPPHY